MGRFSEQERALVRAWKKANQAERAALEAAAERILMPVTPQIQYEMGVRGYSAQDMAQLTGVAPERVEKIRDARLEPLRSFLRDNEWLIKDCKREKAPVEGALLKLALEGKDQTVVKDMLELIIICARLEVPVKCAVQDFLSEEIAARVEADSGN